MASVAESLANRFHHPGRPPVAAPVERASSYEAQETAVLDSLRYLLEHNIPFSIGADVDKNLGMYKSFQGEIPGLDPRGIDINPDAKEALATMQNLAVQVDANTSRGAAEVSQYLEIPGMTIIGSQGLEVRRVDHTDFNKGESKIDPRFKEYQPQINGIMQDVYTQFASEVLGIEHIEIPTEPVFELPTPEGGRIIVQMKGQSEGFPLGIAMALNVNQPIKGTPEDYIARRDEIAEIQQRYLQAFRDIFDGTWAKYFPNVSQETLKNIISIRTRNESILYEGTRIPTLDLEVRPGMETGKGFAQLQRMMTDADPRKADNFKGLPAVRFSFFSGDSVDLRQPDKNVKRKYRRARWGAGQDWAPMHVGHLAYALSHGTRGVIGIQTLRAGETDQRIPNVDIVVDGPAGLGQLLKKMAAVVQEYRQQAA